MAEDNRLRIGLGEIYRDLLKNDAFQRGSTETQQADSLLGAKLMEREKRIVERNRYLAWKRGITPAQLWMDVLSGSAKPPTAEELSELRSRGLIDESGDVPGLGI
ncbi:hypothetical protein [Nostoc sp. GT001]|uniref:hypothetical protein n=1 Tax=Nostoc sp. GT001 TaxID=3056647 RepID=UPI0025AA60CC|nr:hypothetical protein [Nostoc sp. GT001]MDM9583141.1 hypothetical protein [Nostoc sp. GT001]